MNKDVQGAMRLAEKLCKGCKMIKPVSEFYSDRQNTDGYYGKCQSCIRLGRRQRYKLRENRQLSEMEKEKRKIGRARWHRKNSHKVKAQRIVRNAVRRGKIKLVTMCESCGLIGKLHKHHADYSKPLEVQWLCHRCHFRIHRKP